VKNGQRNIVNFKLTGSRGDDFAKANKLAGFSETPKGYVWHHVDNFNPKTGRATLKLVEQGAHKATFPHKGSAGQYQDHYNVNYRS
jgi:hypothetical protein